MKDVVNPKEYYDDEGGTIAPFDAPPAEKYSGPTEDDLTWDEFRAANPDEANELERDFPDENELSMAQFQKKGSGRWFMSTGSGKRMAYLGSKAGWEDLDDGESPTGEF